MTGLSAHSLWTVAPALALVGCLALMVAAGRREHRVRGRLTAMLAVERGRSGSRGGVRRGRRGRGRDAGARRSGRRSPDGSWSVEW